jgi:hypothetical protein
MKKINLLFLGTLCFALIFTGCKKEDDAQSLLEVNDNSYKLSHGGIEYYGDYSASNFSMAVDLLSSGLTMDEEGVWHKSGVGLWMQFVTTAKDGIPTGTYVFSDSGTQFTLKNASYSTQFIENTNINLSTLNDGIVYVERTGNNYSIKLIGKDGNNNNIRAEFHGKLEVTVTPNQTK